MIAILRMMVMMMNTATMWKKEVGIVYHTVQDVIHAKFSCCPLNLNADFFVI